MCSNLTYQLSKVGVFRYCLTSSDTSRELQHGRKTTDDYEMFEGCRTIKLCSVAIQYLNVPHLKKLFTDVLTLLPGFPQCSLMVEGGGLVSSL